MEQYADIVLPLAQPTYTYAITGFANVKEGQAVAVQFGARRIYTGIVWRIHQKRPGVQRVKSISRILYDVPIVDIQQRTLWTWLADYYMCTLGEVMRFALPQTIKPSGNSEEEFAGHEYKPRVERVVSLDNSLQTHDAIEQMIAWLTRRASRQCEALQEIVRMLSIVKETELPCRLLSKKTLTMLPALAKRGLIILQQRKSCEVYNKSIAPLPTLSDLQQQCLTSINQYFQSGKSAVLLQGVTGSGKTELYIHLIAETISQQGDVLLLVPEIAITSQLVKRLERIFGNRVTVYHSKLSVRHRSEVYMQMLHSEGGELVVGTRSALFLPFRHLRLIVVDEEHDRSYKQADVQPRYNARDVAVMMAKVWHCHTLLGSATPSLESYVNAVTNKYGLVQLSERYGGVKHPHIMVSDTIQAAKRNERKKHFNLLLLQKIKEKLALGEQVMLFQNRRGYSPYVECKACGWTARCPRCNVTLVYHHREQLRCHYCGYTIPFVRECPQCRKMEVTSVGFGTEKVEDELLRLIPDVRVERLDGDTATSNKAYRAIIERFASGESDVLIGTQMITKGFDFPNVSLVGILNADNLLLNPDFRAAERAFQLMIQMAGRTGRRDKRGEVIIQTSEPEHPIILQIEKEDYEAMARTQLSERYTYGYPPYARLILLTLYHRDESLLWQASMELSSLLKNHFGRRVQGPMSPAVNRIRGLYIVTVMLKIESGASMAKARQILRSELQLFFVRREYKTITYDCDVDPQ